jgi:exodeoxyribonuclease-5
VVTTQAQAMTRIQDWLKLGRSAEFRLGGLAGTGKTHLAGRLEEALGLVGRVGYAAFTGRAAQNLMARNPGLRAQTLHSLLYRNPYSRHCAKCPYTTRGLACHVRRGARCGCSEDLLWVPKLPEEVERFALLVVDEASMVNQQLYDKLCGYAAATGCRLLFIGDHGQLGPVRSALNLMAEAGLDVKLETIHRQAAGSPILQAAMLARKGLRAGAVLDQLPGDDDVVTGEYRGQFSPDWGRQQVLVWSNAERLALNRRARLALGHKGDAPAVGDRVICLRNIANAGVYNGTCGTVAGVGGRDGLEVDLDDGGLYKGRASPTQFNRDGTEAYEDRVKGVDLWDYAYALTVHKAQGTESPHVAVYDARGMRADYPRWLYTAITRARESVVIVE